MTDPRASASPTIHGHSRSQENVYEVLNFVLFLDNLKKVTRQNPLVDGTRRERTAEHSWHVAMAVLCFHQYATEQIDLGRAVQLAVVHDLPETVVGDTFVYSPAIKSRRDREQTAMQECVVKKASEVGDYIMKAWEEYEYEASPEGRFVMAVDVLLPVFINSVAGDRSSWAKHGVSDDEVRRRVKRVYDTLPRLADLALGAIEDALRQGLLS